MFLIAEPADIIGGRDTDVYFERTLSVLRARGVNPEVRAEFIAKGFPNQWPWAVLAGLNEALDLLGTLPVRVRSFPEGALFYPYEPVLEIEGRYADFCVFETALLGLLCQASGIATQAARFKNLAGERLVMSFGARRMHPAIAPMIERNAFVGGCDGVSVVKSGELLGRDPLGTMPHSLVLCMGSTLAAVTAFDEVIDPSVKRVALIDTFEDEKFEALRIAEALQDRLFAMRFDTPASRRGNLYRILEEVRWELDQRGLGAIRFFVSGGIGEGDVSVLNPLTHGYGIGTAISNAPVIDFALDIVEIDGQPRAKRGKMSGSKSVLVCERCKIRRVTPRSEGPVPACSCGGRFADILTPVLDRGAMLTGRRTTDEIRSFVREGVKDLPLQAAAAGS